MEKGKCFKCLKTIMQHRMGAHRITIDSLVLTETFWICPRCMRELRLFLKDPGLGVNPDSGGEGERKGFDGSRDTNIN